MQIDELNKHIERDEIDNKEESLIGAQYLTFIIANEKYGIPIDDVIEVIDYIPVTKIPLSPDYIEGVINLRGSIIPVINLSYRFFKKKNEQTKFTSIIMIEIFDNEETLIIGLMIDAVKEVLFIPEKNIDEKPDFGTNIRNDFIEGVGKVNGEFIILLNNSTVLDIKELSDF